MSEEKEPTSRVVFLVALVAVLLPFAYVGMRLAKQSEWLSIPHRMPFVNAEGKKLPQSLSAPEECRMGDIAFGMLIDGDKVWIPCKGSDQRGGLARMDLAQKRVDYRWQFPDWKVGWTRGLLPVANGGLATLVGIDGGIGAAVAGPDGWLLAPQKLVVGETDRVLGLAFRDGVLHVAMSRIDANKKPAWTSSIVTFENGGVRSRNVEVCGEKCGGIHGAYFGADSRFHFIVSRDYSALAEDITEDGVARPSKTKLMSFIELDSTSSGAIGTTFTTRYVLGDNGAVVERPPPPVWLHGSVWASIAFARSGDRLSRIPSYASDGSHALELIFVLLAPLFVLGAWLGRRRYPRAMIALAVVTPTLAIWCSVGLSDLLR